MPDPPDVRYVIVPRTTGGARPNEFAHTMAAHPLAYQELPFDPEYVSYAGRFSSMSMSNADADELYWLVRRQVVMRHTGELPLEIRGPDAPQLVDYLFPRSTTEMRVGRCSYQFPCFYDGGMITDGVLMRLAEDRFWFVQGDGDLYSWLRAHVRGFDAEVIDPGVWVSQVQGPDALAVLAAAVDDGGYPERFRYFDIAEVPIAGQQVIVTRTGFTNELGWEFYITAGDARAVGDRILAAGEPFGMKPGSAAAFRARRIEAGILNAGSDFDDTVTPYAAGLGHLVDLDGGDFLGRDALATADRGRRVWGLRVRGGVARLGRVLTGAGGAVCSSGWSPFQQCGVAIVRLDEPGPGPGTVVEVECLDGEHHAAEICDTPMYDEERAIPRGKLVDIPEIPD